MKLFVWDFHGVLEYGNDNAVLEITNFVLKRNGHSREMTLEESLMLCGRRWYEYFAFLLPSTTEQEHFKLQADCFEISQIFPEITTRHVRLTDHADDVLNQISRSQHCQILISNTAPRALDQYVRFVNIEKYFPSSHRFGADAHTQKQLSKMDYLQQFLSKNDKIDTVVSIGDSPGDMALIDLKCHRKGIGYLYTHPGKKHREANCHYKIHDLRLALQEL